MFTVSASTAAIRATRYSWAPSMGSIARYSRCTPPRRGLSSTRTMSMYIRIGTNVQEERVTELLLFLSTFISVFALGVQSLNVNNGHYVAAFFTSFLIGGANLMLFRLAPNATGLQIAAYLSGGAIGIICAMRVFAWVRGRRAK